MCACMHEMEDCEKELHAPKTLVFTLLLQKIAQHLYSL